MSIEKYQSSNKLSSVPTFERRLYTVFALIILVFVIIFYLLFSNYRKAKTSAQWVEHTWRVLYMSEKLNQEYKDMMAQSRGYAVTGNNNYRKIFVLDTINLAHTLDSLKKLTADNPLQQRDVEDLKLALRQRVNFAVRVMLMKQTVGVNEAADLIERGAGLKLSARLEKTVSNIQHTEQHLLSIRTKANEDSGRRMFVVTWILMVALIIVILVVLYFLINSVRLRVRIAEELKKAEVQAEILKGESKYRETLDNMLEGVQIIDRDWRYVYVNNSLVRQSKLKNEELLGHTMMERYPGIEKTAMFAQLQQCMNERETLVMENEFTFPNGSSGCFELSVQPVPEGIFILSIDISERKKAEKELKQLTEALEEKVTERTAQLSAVNAELESFSYSVSHDLRAPLRAISGYSSILEEDYGTKLDEEGKQVLQVIKDNTKRMDQLINDLLGFSRMGKHELDKTELDMNKLANAVVKEQLETHKNIQPVINIKELDTVFADESLIRQVLVNLISNAIKYSAKKEEPEIEIGSYRENGNIVFYVKDNGEGFSMDYYSKLFGVFQRLHDAKDYEGNGVGLALVKRIITRHMGQVWAEGKVKEGATFYFSLPDRKKL